MTASLTRSNPARTTLALAAASALLLGVTACSGDDEDPFAKVDTSRPTTTAAAAAASPADLPTDVPTALPESGAKVQGSALARRIGDAARDKRTVAFDVLATGAESVAGSGVARGSGASSQLKIDVKVGAQDLGIVKTGGAVYFRTPSPLNGKPWLRISTDPKDPLARMYSQAFLNLDNVADVPRVASFVAGMGAFTEASKEQVDGAETTKYVAQPPPAKAVQLLSGPYQALTAQSLKGATATVSLWVDGDGLLRRTAVVFTMRNAPPARTLVSYKRWGQPVTVAAPPAGQVLTPPTGAP
jgi:hypothetical protein